MGSNIKVTWLLSKSSKKVQKGDVCSSGICPQCWLLSPMPEGETFHPPLFNDHQPRQEKLCLRTPLSKWWPTACEWTSYKIMTFKRLEPVDCCVSGLTRPLQVPDVYRSRSQPVVYHPQWVKCPIANEPVLSAVQEQDILHKWTWCTPKAAPKQLVRQFPASPTFYYRNTTDLSATSDQP